MGGNDKINPFDKNIYLFIYYIIILYHIYSFQKLTNLHWNNPVLGRLWCIFISIRKKRKRTRNVLASWLMSGPALFLIYRPISRRSRKRRGCRGTWSRRLKREERLKMVDLLKNHRILIRPWKEIPSTVVDNNR